ncbi:MAG TPA: hypothetical protein VFM02_03835 [Candidatus Paceibacterota bacterium]|nr:hypothetical protein [Candidatus Paceibacterota bacterium]
MGDKKQIGLFILLVAVLAVAYFGYRSFSSGQKGAALISGDANQESATVAGQQILSLLDDLKKIHLDDSIFADPSFLSLKDFTVSIQNQPKGRPNPFSPIGDDDFSGFQREDMTSDASSSSAGTSSSVAGSQTSVIPTGTQTNPNSSESAPSDSSANSGTAPTNQPTSDNSFGSPVNSGPTVPPPSPAVPSM